MGQNNFHLEETNEKRIYIDMLMNFIEQNDMPTILKTLKKFLNLGEIRKHKNYTIIKSKQEEEDLMLKNLE